MKAKAVSIQIPNPCNQNWDAMHIENDGRFCQSCQKTVIDFSAHSNVEIVKIIANSTTGVCGRLTQRQLKGLTYHLIATPPNITWRKYLSVFALGASFFMQSCEKQPMVKGEVVIVDENSNREKPKIVSKIYGYIKDDYNEPMVGYKVAIANTNLFAITDEKGKYEIKSNLSFDTTKNQLVCENQIKDMIRINYNKEQQDVITIEKEYDIVGLVLIAPPKN